MIPLLILAGLAIAGTAVEITFWDQIKKYLAVAFDKVKKSINASIIGAMAYDQTGNWREGIKAAYKCYSKNAEGQWQETVTTKTITADEVPAHIRKKLEATTQPIDISDELELELT